MVGIGVGRLIAWRADAILSSGREVNALKMEFSFTTATILSGFALGFLISLITIVFSSIRIARFNVIRAIRDIQEPPRVRPRRRYALGGLVVALLGVAYSILGFGGPNGYGVMLGPALVVAGRGPAAGPSLAGPPRDHDGCHARPGVGGRGACRSLGVDGRPDRHPDLPRPGA